MLALAKRAGERARSLRLARESEKQKRKVNLGPGALQCLASQGAWVANAFPLNHFRDAATMRVGTYSEPPGGSGTWADAEDVSYAGN